MSEFGEVITDEFGNVLIPENTIKEVVQTKLWNATEFAAEIQKINDLVQELQERKVVLAQQLARLNKP